MAGNSPPIASIFSSGTVVSSGYPIFVSKDTSGTMVVPTGNYLWTGTLWIAASGDTNGNAQVSLTGSNTTLDSTTAVLGASAEYTSGQWISVAKYKSIVGSVFADQTGTLNIQQSYDQTNADVQSTVNVSANAGQGFEISVVAPYMKLHYVNGTTAQTVFRLYAGGKNL